MGIVGTVVHYFWWLGPMMEKAAEESG